MMDDVMMSRIPIPLDACKEFAALAVNIKLGGSATLDKYVFLPFYVTKKGG